MEESTWFFHLLLDFPYCYALELNASWAPMSQSMHPHIKEYFSDKANNVKEALPSRA
jgi:hypothetical protein